MRDWKCLSIKLRKIAYYCSNIFTIKGVKPNSFPFALLGPVFFLFFLVLFLVL